MYIRAKRICSDPQRRRRGEEPICVAVRINLLQSSVRQDEARLSLLTSCHLITLPCVGRLVPNAERLRYQGPPVSLFASRGVSVPSARLGSACVRPCTCAIVHRGSRVVEEGVKGGGGGACWLADPASCCHGACGSLRDNLASPEKPRLERHQSRHARVEGAEKNKSVK